MGVKGQCWTEMGCKCFGFVFATGGSVETIFLAPRARRRRGATDCCWAGLTMDAVARAYWEGGGGGASGVGRGGGGGVGGVKKDNAFLYLCLPA